MDFNKEEIKLYPFMKRELKIEASDEESTATYPVEEEVVGSEDFKIDIEDNHIKEEIEEINENNEGCEEELERARNMYETGSDPFEAERSQATLRYVKTGSPEAIASQNTERNVEAETPASKPYQRQSSINKSPRQSLCCMKCQYKTVESSAFINHWLKHRTLSYEKLPATRGAFDCEEEECHFKATTKGELLRHIENHNLYFNYQCDFCHYTTYFRRDFLQHNYMHDIFQCTICKLQSTKKIFVQDHLVQPWICSECGFATHHWMIIKKHIFMHNLSTGPFVICSVCSFIARSNAVMQLHMRTHKKHFVPCKVCNFKTKNMGVLALHYKDTHSMTCDVAEKILPPLNKCKFCDCEFKNETLLGQHLVLHFDKGSAFKCGDCVDFDTADDGDCVYECPYCCDKNNLYLSDIYRHILLKHPANLQLEGFRYEDKSKGSENVETVDVKIIDKSRDIGEECSNIGTREEPQGGHILADEASRKTVDDVSAFGETETSCLCPICFAVTRGEGNFERHLANNHNFSTECIQSMDKKKLVVPQYQCDFCNYMTLSELNLSKHNNTHIIFKCSKCSFESTKELFVDNHTEETYACKMCTFKTHHWLHLKKHTFQHKYAHSSIICCTLCTFTTKSTATIKKHRAIHEKRVIRCQIQECQFIAQSINDLQKHSIRCHDTILEFKLQRLQENALHMKCKYCECRFKHIIYLYKHQAIHTQNGPNFKCSQCISQESTNPKKRCAYCNYDTSDMGELIDHMENKHAESLENESYRFEKCDVIEKSDETTVSDVQTENRGKKDRPSVATDQLPTNFTQTTKHESYDTEEDKRAMLHPQVQASQRKIEFHARMTDLPRENIQIVNTKYTTPCGANVAVFHNAAMHNEDIHQYIFEQTVEMQKNIQEVSGSPVYQKAHPRTKNLFRSDREKVPCKQAGCKFEASSVDELSIHMAQHLQSTMKSVLTYKCERCGFGSLSKSISSGHKKSCEQMPWYRCYHCTYNTNHISDIRDHLTRMHTFTYKRKRGYECKKCGFRTNKKASIDLHYANDYSDRCVKER